jgi:hypothetical protein
MKMEEQIKKSRVRIDGLAQLTKELKPIYDMHSRNNRKSNSKEIENAHQSLIFAKAWQPRHIKGKVRKGRIPMGG